MSSPITKRHRILVQYLKQTIIWLEEHDPQGPDNEIILLNLIRELQASSQVDIAILRERIEHIATQTHEQANPKWVNPFIHWSVYKTWAEKTLKTLNLPIHEQLV